MTRLQYWLSRYRKQIRADLLSHFGVDLRDELKLGCYRRLLELIEELPVACRWREAAMQDPQYKQGIETRIKSEIETLGYKKFKEKYEGSGGGNWRPRWSEYSLDNIQMSNLIAMVGQVLNVLGAEIKPDEFMFPSPENPEDDILNKALDDADREEEVSTLAKIFGLDE